MNLGLGNLASLKAFVLPEALGSETTFDARLQTIGKGVAAAMERECNRKFGRVVGEEFVCSADRSYVSLPRFPVEEVTKIERQDDLTTGYVELAANTLLNLDISVGMADFGYPMGIYRSLLRLTYTGGFFFEPLEPTDEGYPTSVPSGSTALPEDLRHAWLLQCQKHFEATRALSTAGVKEDNKAPLISTRLDEGTLALLAPYRRFA